MKQNSQLKYLLRILLVVSVYFLTARLSLLLQFQHSNATPVWPPSGIALAAVLFFGYRMAPAIFLGAFAVNVVVFLANKTCDLQTALWVSSFIGAGNTGEALMGCYLLKRLIPTVRDNNYFRKVAHIFGFFYVAAVMCIVSGVMGVSAVYASGIIPSSQFLEVAFTWWLGDTSGVLLFAPLVLTWASSLERGKGLSMPKGYYIELTVLFCLAILCGGIIFDNWFLSSPVFQWAFWIIPVLIWSSLRLRQRHAVSVLVLSCIMAIWGTINGGGPFSSDNLHQSLLVVQSFVSIMVLTMLALNASISESRQAMASFRNLHRELETRITSRTAELRQEKDFVNTLFDSVEDLMAVFDREGNYIAINKQAEEMYKLKRKDIIGKNILELFPSAKESGVYDNYLRALKGETVRNPSYFSQAVGRYFENLYIPLKNNEEEIYGVLTIGHDITEAIKTSEHIRQSEEKFRELLNASPDATVIVNEKGKIVLINSQTEKLFGYTRQELLGQPVEILIPERFSQRHSGHRQQYFAGHPKARGMGAGFDLYARRKDGTEFSVEISLSPLQTEEGLWVSSSIRDITQRKQAEQLLKESEARIQSIFKSAPDAIIVINNEGKIVGWNPMAETVFGWRPETVIGKYLHETIIPRRLREAHKNGLMNYLETGMGNVINRTVEMPALHKNGHEFYVSLSISLTMIKGETFFTAFANDITELKKAQEEIKQKTDELERSNQELEQFAYAASHDLQEPLRTMIAFLQLVEKRYKNKLDEQGQEFIHRAVNSADRMRTLINDLLIYSRVGSQKHEFTEVNCRSVLNVVLDNLHKSILESKATISITSGIPVVQGDELHLTLLFQNLISNAIKFRNKKPPQVNIDVEEQNSHWQFSVRDNGIGIPKEFADRIFEIFQRLHTRDEYSGTGIGLAVSKKIVENHGGKIWVESENGQGSTFYFTLKK